MKKISEYLYQPDYLDNQIITQANISIAFNSRDYFNNPQYFTFESIGVFKGCKEIVKYIMDHLSEYIFDPADDEWDIKGSKIPANVFFDKLKLHFDTNDQNGITGAYIVGRSDPDEQLEYDKLRWDSKANRFKFIEIYIYNVKNIEDDSHLIALMLTHELTHAYEDYMIRSKDDALNNGLFKSYYKGAVMDIKKEFKSILDQKKTGGNLNSDTMDTILYLLNKPEVNAYLAELDTELKNKKFKDAKEAMAYISQNSVPYRNYKEIFHIFNSGQYDNELEKFGFKQSSINKIKKISRDVWTKIVNHIYNIISDHIEYNLTLENCFIKLEDTNKKIYER